MHFYEPASGTGLPHSPFKSIVGPRPIGWISTQSLSGVLNLAPFSYFNAFCDEPPIVGFAGLGPRDTVNNARETGEFCWNLATEDLAQAMNTSSAGVGPEVDEFDLAGLTSAASRVIGVPRVAEARVAFECRVSQIVPLVTASGSETQSTLVLGEVVGVHIDEALLVDGVYQTSAARPILRAGGLATYFGISDAHSFEMERPS